LLKKFAGLLDCWWIKRVMATPGEYTVGVTIGEGAYGHVIHGKHKQSGRDVAIKVIEKVSVSRKPYVMDCIWTEQKLLQEFKSSECVVNLWASFHDSECLYLVMECCRGGDLSNVIEHGTHSNLRDETAWKESIPHYGLQLVEALAYIHSHNVIHCDLSPSNILCTSQGHIQLADFGCAVNLKPQDSQAHGNNQTSGNVRVHGTADYACPEILRGSKDLTVAVDMWSLGCIFYALNCGQSPFHTQSDFLTVQAVFDYVKSTDTIVSPFESQNLSQEWRELIRGLLQGDPAQRLGSDPASYKSIRDHPVLEDVDFMKNPNPSLLPPEPQWIKESNTTSMRDGRHGWAAFLI
jgi:3-phosphoinositide dependent protein kinase-1